MRMTVVYPDDFCGCVRFKSDVVTYAKPNWDGVDDLEDLGMVLGLDQRSEVLLGEPVGGEL